jgi:hypothetical protein
VIAVAVTAFALAVAFVAAVRSRATDAVVLLVMVVVELACGIYSITRIVGPIEFYLVQWLSAIGFVLWLAVGNALLASARRLSTKRWYRTAAVAVAVVLLGLASLGAVRASSPDVREANEVLALRENRHLFGRLPLRALLEATRPGAPVALRLDSESAWEVMAADALQLAEHDRNVRIVSSPVTQLLFDHSMLVDGHTRSTVLAFSERAEKPRGDASRLLALQGRWRISVRDRR